MKIINTVSLLLTACAFCSCGNSSVQQTQAEAEKSKIVMTPTVELTGEQRFEDVSMSGDVIIKEKQYHYEIDRLSSNDLPLVPGDFSPKARFHDNVARLTVTCGDRKVFSHTYNKKEFADFVDSDMMAKSVLRGFVFVEASENGLEFAIAVGYPQDDEMYVPILLKLKIDGSTTLERDTTLDEPAVSAAEEGV